MPTSPHGAILAANDAAALDAQYRRALADLDAAAREAHRARVREQQARERAAALAGQKRRLERRRST